jgi:hypothetical protein
MKTKSQAEYGSQETVDARDAAVGPTESLGAIKTTIPIYPPISTPNAGTTQRPGKERTQLEIGRSYKAEPVRDAQEVKGAALKATSIQVQGDGGSNSPNGDHHKRGRNYWGVDEPRNE